MSVSDFDFVYMNGIQTEIYTKLLIYLFWNNTASIPRLHIDMISNWHDVLA